MGIQPARVRRRRKYRLRQIALPFDVEVRTDHVEPVVTRTRRRKHVKPLACYFGTPWLDHFDPPVGTGAGCNYCANYRGIGTETDEERGHDQRA